MAAPAPPSPTDWFVLHARLQDVDDPAIWRQLSVPPTTTVQELHLLMQAAFGWSGGHLHFWYIRPVTHIDGYHPPVRTELNPGSFSLPSMRLAAQSVDPPRPDKPGYYDNDLRPDNPEEAAMFAQFGPMRFTDDDDYGLPPNLTISEMDATYDLAGYRHALLYEYDMGDGWEHIITVEKRMPALAKVSGGGGHKAAEDVGGPHGWEHLKKAYDVKNTSSDTPGYHARRRWYEAGCSNGNLRGLNRQIRGVFNATSTNTANKLYQVLLKHEAENAENGELDSQSDD